jgi:hypothetical protein
MHPKLTPRYSVGDHVIDTTNQNKGYTIKDVINHPNDFTGGYVLEDPTSGHYLSGVLEQNLLPAE